MKEYIFKLKHVEEKTKSGWSLECEELDIEAFRLNGGFKVFGDMERRIREISHSIISIPDKYLTPAGQDKKRKYKELIK